MCFDIHIDAPDFRRENAAVARAQISQDLGYESAPSEDTK